jgi:hypothetical protein
MLKPGTLPPVSATAVIIYVCVVYAQVDAINNYFMGVVSSPA